MVATTGMPIHLLTAAELMSRDVVLMPREISLHTAARLLANSNVSGAPVVDESGRCVGVLSTTDFMRWAGKGEKSPVRTVSSHCDLFFSAWQVADVEQVPDDMAANYMTADPVTVPPSTSIVELARLMTDAHIHRIIVVDALKRPIGVVSSTDLIAALANADFRHHAVD